MRFNRILQWLLPVLMSLFLVTGCGDLEPDMQDTRTVILKMDFHGKSSSRSSSSVSASELSQYNTHLILALPSREYLTSSYKNYYSSFAQGLMNTADKKVSLEIPLNTQMKIFAFLFKEDYSMSELFSGVREVGYYGESQSFSIDTNTNSLSLGITLQPTGTDTNTGGGSTDTTPPVIAEVTPITTPTTDTTPDYTFSSSEAGTMTYGGSCATAGSAKTNVIVGHNLIIFNTLSSGTYSDCTITVTDSAGNVSNTLSVTPFTVNSTVTNVTIDTTLLAHYAFEDNLNDNSSYNRHLTEVGSNITYSAADNQSNKSGRAALFNGSNTYAYTDNITVGDNFTIAFWTNPDSPNMGEWASVMSTGNNTSDGRFQIDYSGADILRFNFTGGVISDNLTANKWNHFVITRSDNGTADNKVCLYKNGGPSSTCDGSFPIHWDFLKVGLNRNGDNYWKGYIDELKIYSRTFSAQEVVDLYESF